MAQMGALHLLIKHQKSRNPVSRRTNQSTAGITVEAAQAELQQYIDAIKRDGVTKDVFAAYAQQRSDCGSYRQGGDLGMFGCVPCWLLVIRAQPPIDPPVHIPLMASTCYQRTLHRRA